MKNTFGLAAIILSLAIGAAAQSSNGNRQPADESKKKNQRTTPAAAKPKVSDETVNAETPLSDADKNAVVDEEVLRVDTDLVTIPVSVADREGRFVAGLTKADFQIFDNGKPQNIEYFAATEVPYTVALVLDMSISAKFKVDEIQTAAYQFVQGLSPKDRVLIISFDEEVRFLSEPTNDRERLRAAIKQTKFAGGTSLYEAMNKTFERMNKIPGRKAVVLFTDGVDTTSRATNDADNLYQSQEFEGLIYPVYYDTYDDVQAQLRNPPVMSPNPVPGAPIPPPQRTPTIPGTTLPFPTFPQGGSNYPRGSRDPNYPNDPNNSRYPRDPNNPNNPNDPNRSRYPNDRRGDDPTNVGFPSDDRDVNTMPGSGTTKAEYRRGKTYLDKLALNTGGRLYQATSYNGLGAAFDQIAAELRQQYSLGYYPAADSRKGEKRTLSVKVNRKKTVVRAREGYVVGKEAKVVKN